MVFWFSTQPEKKESGARATARREGSSAGLLRQNRYPKPMEGSARWVMRSAPASPVKS